MQRDATRPTGWRGVYVALSKATARVMDPGHLRTPPLSALFETLSADVLELTIPSRGYRTDVVQDTFSTFILLVPLKTQHSEEVLIERDTSGRRTSSSRTADRVHVGPHC
jgi:hypothetical protein